MSVDTLSDVLRAVRLRGAVFFDFEGSAPWVAEAPAACDIGPHIMPGVEHVIEYHVITRGSCWGGLIGEPAIELTAGDIIVFPQGDPHVMSSAPGMRGDVDMDVYTSEHAKLPISMSLHGGGPERVEVVCGFLGCDTRPFNPLLSTLPRVLKVPRQSSPGSLLDQLVRLAVTESDTRNPGSESVLARLSELLFIEVVRRHVATLPPEQTGWLSGLRDEYVGRALSALHDCPAQQWTLDDLAKESALSRSMLAERFAHYVGVPPMQYLAQWRMQLAASLLSGSTLGISQIAERVGYGSEAALSRAFKRLVGVAPSDWRKGRRIKTPP